MLTDEDRETLRRRFHQLDGVVPSLAAMVAGGIVSSNPAVPPDKIAEKAVTIALSILTECEARRNRVIPELERV